MTAKIALACLLAIAPSMALAVADGPDHFTTRNLAKGESLTVRLGPSMSAPAAGKAIALTGGKASVKGEIRGDQVSIYRVPAGAGQKLTVAMKVSNPQAYFNVSAPGSAPVAMFNGSMGGKFDGVMLPDDGEYVVTVYLMRAAARRNEHAAYTLTVKLDGQALKPVSAAKDALVNGTRYHAKAVIPCTPPFGLKVPCDAGVVRRGNVGTATVDIAIGTDLRRRILFVAGEPAATDATADMKAARRGDVTVVTIDDESYAIPDALISGG